MLIIDDLMRIYPEYTWVEFTAEEREIAWKQAVRNRKDNTACNRNYLNQLCLNIFVKWLKDEPDLKEKIDIPLQSQDLYPQWKIVDGINLKLKQTRLVLFPSEQTNPKEFLIPQEWIDIPNWASNYYLPIQLNIEEGWLRVWGFISHEQVRKKAEYDLIDRTYCVNPKDLITDINIMWVAQELCTLKQPQTETLPNLLESQAQDIIEELSKPNVSSPRLHLSFPEWGAILASDKYRRALYNKKKKDIPINLAHNTEKTVRNLSLWFENIFDEGWRSVDDFLGLIDGKACQFRSDSVLNEVCVKGAKLIDLGMKLDSESLALLIGLSPQSDNKVGVRVQLYPGSGETYLPDSVKLALLSESGAILQSVESRSYDNYIQLKRFKLPLGKYFSIQVARKDIKIKENFVIEGFNC